MSHERDSLELKGQDLFSTVVFGEGLLIVAALGLAWLGLYDRNQPLSLAWLQEKWLLAILWGVIATAPCLVLLFALPYSSFQPLEKLTTLVKSRIVPLFEGMSAWKLLIVSVLAGLGEELLFRWAIQGGLEYLIGKPFGLWFALIIASLLFGLCHYLSTAYAVLAGGIGFYLGLLMIFTDTWLAPAVTHALYDFVALLYLTDRLPLKFSAT